MNIQQKQLRMVFYLLILSVIHVHPSDAAGFIKWEAVNKGLDLGAGSGITEIATNQAGVVFTIVDGTGLFKSTDGGNAWTHLTGDTPPLQAPYTVAVAPGAGGAVFVGTVTPGSGLWRSDDAGKTWTKAGGAAAGMASSDVESVAFAPDTPGLMLVGHRGGRLLSVSTNGGKTWKTSDLGVEVKQQLPILVTDSHWIVASRSGGALRFTDNAGGQWQDGDGGSDYFGGPLPVVRTGDFLFESRHHGFVKSTDAGKTWNYTMEQHTRMVGTAGDSVFRENRQGIRGTDDRIFTLEISDNYGQSWSDVTEGLQRAVPDNLRSNLVISNKVDPFAHVRVATAWSSVPGGRTVFLGLGKAGLYRGRFLWTAKGPRVVAPQVSPRSVVEGDDNVDVKVSVVASPRSGPMRKVYADLNTFGLPDLELYDDGQHGDGAAGDKVYANHFVAPRGLVAGDRVIGVVAEDAADRVSSTEMHLLVASPTGRLTVWDGDQFTGGFAWVSPKQPLISFGAQTDEVHGGKVAMELHAEGSGAISGGWNWHGFYPADSGDDVTAYRNLTFWMKVDGESKPDGIKVSVVGNDAKASTPVDVTAYAQSLMDGAWHDVVIPLRDTITPDSGFNAAKVWMLDIDTWSATPRNFSVYLDDVGFDNRRVRSMNELISQAVPRAVTSVGGNAAAVTAQVDVTSPGTLISPYIYGAASGDRKAANEMGLVSLRSGGNEATPVNWKHGYNSKGNDWFFQNYGEETPPEKNSLVTFFGDNKKAGLDSYLTMPMMGRVAKDGTSFAFDIRKYPDQESWAGKVQPGDRLANAGNGKQFVKGPDGQYLKDKNGKPVLQDIEANPDDTSVEMSPEEQTQMLAFMVKNMGYNTADQGGLKYIALDNEPTLWNSTHQGMHPKATSYDELWDRTRT